MRTVRILRGTSGGSFTWAASGTVPSPRARANRPRYTCNAATRTVAPLSIHTRSGTNLTAGPCPREARCTFLSVAYTSVSVALGGRSGGGDYAPDRSRSTMTVDIAPSRGGDTTI